MLSSNVVNNARFVGDRMRLTEVDVLCCPPPLFHCFGLVLGLLACISYGAKVVYPAETFDARATLRALETEQCSVLHGVPAMFDSLFSISNRLAVRPNIRTGIVAGSPVPTHIMKKMVSEFGMKGFTSSYGLTEASPTCFNAVPEDSIDIKLTTVGTLLPHAHAKIVGLDGKIVPIGQRGELLIAGYQIQSGYWANQEKTREAMVLDENGVLWLKTGDEAVFDANGRCTITGRFKDLIIRGGENIYPLEIENSLLSHPAIDKAFVVGIKDHRLGEVVGALLVGSSGISRPSKDELRSWTQRTLGRHKSPQHIFWLGEGSVPAVIPLTGSGKVQKFILKEYAEKALLTQAKL
jgi:acyl-CoA synthetase (AMP-forming)/AMP-acid ligase II